MKARLGAIGRMLDAAGRLTGCAVQWEPGSGARSRDGEGTRICALPVTGESGARGLLVARARAGKRGAPAARAEWLRLLRAAARLLDERREAAGESLQLAEELEQAYEDLFLFSRIAARMQSMRFSGEQLRDLLEEIRESMRVELAAAAFTGKPENNVETACPDIAGIVPDPATFLAALRAEMPRSAPAFEERGLIVNRSTELPAFRGLHPAPFRALAARIQSGERTYGWLLLVSFDMKKIFRWREYRLLSAMAEQVALMTLNSALYDDLERSVINLVKSLVMAIEAKDGYTRGHSERVHSSCMRIADGLGLDGRQRTALQWASVLHDVGKIGTPETILNKPARLSGSEYERIKSHPVKGAEILRPITQLADALPAIRHHHERYNGSGYPDGLRGESIPLLARVITVADIYDAVTSTRAYRAARSHREAMRIIAEGTGSQFDPKVVDAFRKTVKGNPAVRRAAGPKKGGSG